MSIAICPGSFDPMTLGHLNIVRRTSRIFEKVVVLVMVNATKKTPMFTIDERVDMIRRITAGYPNVTVDTFDGLLAEYAKRYEHAIIVKGLRAGTPDVADKQDDKPCARDHVPDFKREVHLSQLVRGAGAGKLRRGLERVFAA